MLRLLSLDFETTGLNASSDRIVEVGLVSVSLGFPTVLHSFVDPGIPIPGEASRVHGVTDAKAALAPPTRDVLCQILDFLEGAEGVVGFNIDDFDWRVLREECRRYGLRDRFQTLDRLLILDVMLHLPRRQNLVAVAHSMFGCDGDFAAHSAEHDARMTAKVFMRGVETGMIGLPEAKWVKA